MQESSTDVYRLADGKILCGRAMEMHAEVSATAVQQPRKEPPAESMHLLSEHRNAIRWASPEKSRGNRKEKPAVAFIHYPSIIHVRLMPVDG